MKKLIDKLHTIKLKKQRNRFTKTMLSCVCLIMIGINTFAAVVSDNDGSAFITKAEFDSYKNTFQAQINQFNTNIDSKIDDAISTYISTVKASKISNMPSLYTSNEGVLSLQSNSFPWAEGRMDMSFYGAVFRYSTAPYGYFEFSLTTSNPTNFSETLISNVDYTKGTGKFVGYYKTKQYFVSNGNNAKAYYFKQAGCTQVTGYNGGYFPASNQELTTYGQLYTIGFYNNTWINDYWLTNVLECQGTNASFRREIVDNNANYTGGLIMNTASIAHKFNNNDEYRDWCNDTITDGHSVATSMSAVGLSGTGFHIGVNSGTATYTDATILTSGDCTGGSARGTQRKPYLGFVSTATDWNKIYLGSFDDIIDKVLISSDPNRSKNIITDTKGNYHLKLGAGLPVVECKSGDKITYEFEFKDKTKNYFLWVNEGSFDSSKDLIADRSNCITSFDLSDTTTYNSAGKCLRIMNGKGKASWRATKNSVIYFKWADDGNVNAGGGIFIPAKTVRVETTS